MIFISFSIILVWMIETWLFLLLINVSCMKSNQIKYNLASFLRHKSRNIFLFVFLNNRLCKRILIEIPLTLPICSFSIRNKKHFINISRWLIFVLYCPYKIHFFIYRKKASHILNSYCERHTWEYYRYTPNCNESVIPNQLPLLGNGTI